MKAKSVGMILGLLVLVTGCAERQLSSTGAVNTEPLVIDQAMQTRSNWEPSLAQYENGDVKHNMVGFAYVADPTINGRVSDPRAVRANEYWTDTGVYVLNLVTSPYTYYQNYRHGTGNISTGVQLPPTYTANPPLPPSPDQPKVMQATETTETNTVVPASNVEVSPATQPSN